MEIYRDEIKKELDCISEYREMLFRRGYLLTSKEILCTEEYPFYGLWQHEVLGSLHLYVQQKQTYYTKAKNDVKVVIVGHAYNPFDGKYLEDELCLDLIDAYEKGLSDYFDKVSELTGLHVIFLIDDGKIFACQDACSLTGCYFGKIGGTLYITEHPQLVADLCDLNMDVMVQKLITSRCYNIGNRHLPGNLSPYRELKRLGANTYMFFDGAFSIKRFYPVAPHPEFSMRDRGGILRIGDLIHSGIECCTKKWDRCAISLSGGTDSKTTLACANGLYDQFSYFSFHSKPQELVDAKGAKRICSKLGLKHTLYHIPEENNAFKTFSLVKKILLHNASYFHNLADNEVRKYIFLHDLDAYDVELKSWASEVGRVFFERKYQIKMPKILNERCCSIFQTRYFGHPKLLKWSDQVYYDFLREIGLEKPLYNFEHSDLLYWEIRMGCWGVSVVSSQQLYHRVTMPMNNRKILELLLSYPHEARKMDSVHKKVMAYQNKKVLDANVEIRNLYFHGYRIWMEKIYFIYRTMLYHRKK